MHLFSLSGVVANIEVVYNQSTDKLYKRGNVIMHTWNELLSEKQNFDFEWRKTYLQALNDYTKRDVIVYYSAWQTKSGPSDLLSITQDDRTSFQAAIDSMLPDSKELDLIIHTPEIGRASCRERV